LSLSLSLIWYISLFLSLFALFLPSNKTEKKKLMISLFVRLSFCRFISLSLRISFSISFFLFLLLSTSRSHYSSLCLFICLYLSFSFIKTLIFLSFFHDWLKQEF
jgi:hypothetical protein